MEVKQSTNKDAGPGSARNMHPPREGPLGGGPLKGIKVLDFTRFQNGPSATRHLADYGATVIKVEAPVGGDEVRALFQMRDGYNPVAQFFNRGKKSITLDIRKPEARPVMEKLIKWADVRRREQWSNDLTWASRFYLLPSLPDPLPPRPSPAPPPFPPFSPPKNPP